MGCFRRCWGKGSFLGGKKNHSASCIDHRCKDVGEDVGDVGAIIYVLTPSIKNSDHPLKQRNGFAKRCVWRYWFQAVIWNLNIQQQVLDCRLLASFWHGYDKSNSDIVLKQLSASSLSNIRFNHVQCWKTNAGLKLWGKSWRRGHAKNAHFHIYSPWH
jgi:hypothetical protein